MKHLKKYEIFHTHSKSKRNSTTLHIYEIETEIGLDIYIDDKCLMGLPETWTEIYNMVKKKEKELKAAEKKTDSTTTDKDKVDDKDKKKEEVKEIHIDNNSNAKNKKLKFF